RFFHPCFTSSSDLPAILLLTSSSFSVLYSLSLHDALPIFLFPLNVRLLPCTFYILITFPIIDLLDLLPTLLLDPLLFDLEKLLRSEEHTSELQSRFDLVCRLLLEIINTNEEHHGT